MKKIILSLALCIALCFSMMSITAFAAEGTDGEITVTASKTNVAVGETVVLTFALNAKTDAVGGIDFIVKLPAGLEYVSHEILVSNTDYMFSSFTPSDGYFGCGATMNGKTGKFNVLKITAKAKDTNLGANAVNVEIVSVGKVDGTTKMNYGTVEPLTITTATHFHNHNQAKFDAENHWKECSCGDKIEVTSHTFSTDFKTNAENHWKECACGAKTENGAHSGGTATCTAKAKCEICNADYGSVATHTHGTEFKNDATNHWNECVCGDKANLAPHADANNDEKCDACSYAMPKAPSNNETEKPTEKPTDATDKPTDATESEKDDSTETDAPVEKGCGGCGSSAALSAVALVGVIGTALVIKKKED